MACDFFFFLSHVILTKFHLPASVFISTALNVFVSVSMASSSKQKLSADQVIQLVYDYDNEMRQAVVVGMHSVRETMQRIGQGLVNKPLPFIMI